MDKWRNEILNGVEKVVFHGSTAGVLVVYGEKSQAILANQIGQVVCAAAEYGKGRLVVFTHNILVKSFLQGEKGPNQYFNDNIIKWLTRSKCNDADVSSFKEFHNKIDTIPSTCKIIAWDKPPFPKENELHKLMTWVASGGSLICGVCPWGFAQVHKIEIDDLPINHILKHIGCSYAGKKTFKTGGGKAEVRIDGNMAACMKPHDIIAEAKKNPSKILELSESMHHIFQWPADMYFTVKPLVFDMIQELTQGTSYLPSKHRPIESPHHKKAAGLHCNVMIRDGKEGKETVAECITGFPGTFDEPPELQCGSFRLKSSGHKYHATGFYLPVGVVMEISWSGAKMPWKVLIGLHKDKLYNVKGKLRRWPKVNMKASLKTSPIKICSPFGGLVYLQSPRNTNDEIDVNLRNVVTAPMFTYKTASSWESIERHKPGLWSDIIGENIAFTIPSRSVRDLPDLTNTVKMWDAVVSAHMELRGKDASEGRGQWVVTDEQPSAGQMHSGYPIVTHLDLADPNEPIYKDCFFPYREVVNKTKGDKRNWGLFHELGHNFQNKLWTWNGTVEVTCNIFTLHAMDVIYNVKPWQHPWLTEKLHKARDYLQSGAVFENWLSNPGIALMVYAQLARDFGWNTYNRVFRIYENLPSDKHPKTDNQKMDMWITTFSNVVERNLCPLFDFWGWPIRKPVLDEVKKYPTYLPDDETTNEFAPDRKDKISKLYC